MYDLFDLIVKYIFDSISVHSNIFKKKMETFVTELKISVWSQEPTNITMLKTLKVFSLNLGTSQGCHDQLTNTLTRKLAETKIGHLPPPKSI